VRKAKLRKQLRQLQTALRDAKKAGSSSAKIINLRKEIMQVVNEISHLTNLAKPVFIPKFVPQYAVRKKKEA
jgi:uncharacterized coiled-coil DUF342 family protein